MGFVGSLEGTNPPCLVRVEAFSQEGVDSGLAILGGKPRR